MAEETKRTAAYVPWGTFRNSLNRLSEGVPNQIDRSVFHGLAGGTQTQLVATMKFLGLIDDNGIPSDELKRLVAVNELERKPLLKRLLERAYPDLIALELASATPEQVDAQMEASYNVGGSTRRKAVRFFLAGAQEAGIELSPFLKKGNGTAATVRRRAPRRRAAATRTTPAAASATAGASKAVPLASGGVLTLSADTDFFGLSADDRRFVFDLIERMEKYEAGQPKQEETEKEDEEEEAPA